MGDEPLAIGGDDLGPRPHELLLAALGACTVMTSRMHARQKLWPLDAMQRARLMDIADKCPVHSTLHSEIHVTTSAPLAPER